MIEISESSHRQVIDQLRLHKKLSGADLSRLTGLQPSTMVYILRRLCSIGIIQKAGYGESTKKGGKKPFLWTITSGKFYIIGIEILPDKIRTAVFDFTGELFLKVEQKPETNMRQKTLSMIITGLLKKTLLDWNLEISKVAGIGIALPGIIDRKRGIIKYSSALGLDNYDFYTPLSDEFDCIIKILNDANAGALGIYWFPENSEKSCSDIIYVTYNQGARNLGAGLLINNSLHEGYTGTAGEIFTPLPALESLYEKHCTDFNESPLYTSLHQNNQGIDLKRVIKEMKEHDCHLSLKIIDRLTNHIAEEMIGIIGLINPQLIVLGGEISDYPELLNDFIRPKIEDGLRKQLKTGFLIPEIRISHFGNYSVASGAAAAVFSEILHKNK
jgi:N-acetylglucosamine repressor